MTRYSFTTDAPIRTRKDGEIAFAMLMIAGRKVRIQTQAADADRPIFTVDGGEIIAHNDAAVALVEGQDDASIRKARTMENLLRREADDLRDQMGAIMADTASEEIYRRAEIVRAHADRIVDERITDEVIAAYIRSGAEAASIALGFGGLISAYEEAEALEREYRAAARGYMPRAALDDEAAEKAAAEREVYARDALPLIERARASWCALTGREMRAHVNPIQSLLLEV